MERHAKRDNQIEFLEQRKSHLKDMKTDSIEDISRKLEGNRILNLTFWNTPVRYDIKIV